MKNVLLSGIILLIVGGIITKYIFNEKVELRYIMSDRIPTNFINNDSTESIQQIEVLNTGDIDLNKIVIKIKARVKDYKVFKIANSDSVQVVKSSDLFELVYPQIPPEGNIKIVIKSIGNGFNLGDIDIKHSKGSAKPALETNNSYDYIFYGLMLIYFILIGFSVRSNLIDSVAFSIYHKPFDKILNRFKPWYLSDDKWKKIREDSMKYVFDYEYVSTSIKDTLYYQLLNSEKPQKINDIEWNKLMSLSQEMLLKRISETVNRGYDLEVAKFTNLKRPKHIEEEFWAKVTTLISNAYKTILISNIKSYLSIEELKLKLNETKPEIIKTKDWEEYTSYVSKMINLIELSEKNEILQEQLEMLIYQTELKEKPIELTPKEWEKLKEIELDIFEKSKQIREDLVELQKLKFEILPLKTKLDKQLKIINEVLTDPTAIDRIEDYENPFNIGNFENLKQIALLKKKITTA